MRKAVEIQRPSGRLRLGKGLSAGFTLLELVIALGVMAAMAGVALDLLVSASDKTAFRKTVERMDRVRALLLEHAGRTVKDRIGGDPALGLMILDNKGDVIGASGSALKSFAGESNLPSSASDDLFFDGWGNELHYFPPAETGTAQEQATGYLVSPGPDRELAYTQPGAVMTVNDDDLVYEISAVKIYDDEAFARAQAINLALLKRRADKDALLGSAADSPTVNSFPEIYFALNGVVLNSAAIDGVDSFGAGYPYLPDDERYQMGPWDLSGIASYGFKPSGSGGAVTGYPVAQVEAIRP